MGYTKVPKGKPKLRDKSKKKKKKTPLPYLEPDQSIKSNMQ